MLKIFLFLQTDEVYIEIETNSFQYNFIGTIE